MNEEIKKLLEKNDIVATALLPIPLNCMSKIAKVFSESYGKGVHFTQDGEYLIFLRPINHQK